MTDDLGTIDGEERRRRIMREANHCRQCGRALYTCQCEPSLNSIAFAPGRKHNYHAKEQTHAQR